MEDFLHPTLPPFPPWRSGRVTWGKASKRAQTGTSVDESHGSHLRAQGFVAAFGGCGQRSRVGGWPVPSLAVQWHFWWLIPSHDKSDSDGADAVFWPRAPGGRKSSYQKNARYQDRRTNNRLQRPPRAGIANHAKIDIVHCPQIRSFLPQNNVLEQTWCGRTEPLCPTII